MNTFLQWYTGTKKKNIVNFLKFHFIKRVKIYILKSSYSLDFINLNLLNFIFEFLIIYMKVSSVLKNILRGDLFTNAGNYYWPSIVTQGS